MRLATIVDIPKIITVLLDTYTEEELLGMEALLSLKSRDTFDFQTFISDEDDIVIFFERMGNFKCQFHLYSLKEARGKKVNNCFYQCVDFLINNTL